MPRFFVSEAVLCSPFAVLDGENAAHAKVLRLRQGDWLTLCDGQGREARATISEISGGKFYLVLSPAEPTSSEPFCRASVYMAYAKSDKIDHVAQKATELGATELVVFPSARCVSRPDEKALEAKCERWQRILRSASEQAGRGRIPRLVACGSYAEAISRAAQAERFLFFYENERQRSLRTALSGSRPETLALMTGPEGGFTPEEVVQAQAQGAQICSLGPRILRCETAPLCALTAALFACGEYD